MTGEFNMNSRPVPMLNNSCFKLVGKSSYACLSNSCLELFTCFPNLSLILNHTCQFSALTESQTVSANQI